VYVAFDTRSATEPPWLMSGFTETGDIVDITDPDKTQEFRVLRRDFAAGSIVLGGNLPSAAMSNYVVFARPLNLTDPQHSFVIQGLPSALIVTIGNVAINVQRQSGQTAAQLAAAVAAAINANPSLVNLRIFALASGNAIATTGVIQSVNVQFPSIPALPLAWAVGLCAALGLVAVAAARGGRRT